MLGQTVRMGQGYLQVSEAERWRWGIPAVSQNDGDEKDRDIVEKTRGRAGGGREEDVEGFFGINKDGNNHQ